MTFSIIAHCPDRRLTGIAASTAVPAIGWLCLHARSGVGAVATQGFTNIGFGHHGLDLMAEGTDADDAVERLLVSDTHPEWRQVAVCDMDGRIAVHSGGRLGRWAGHRRGPGFVAMGNLLHGPATLDAMTAAFEDTRGEPLHERMMSALVAGQAAGGDIRGRRSAAILIQGASPWPALDVRVDDHPEPVAELGRVLASVSNATIPFTDGVCPMGGLGIAPQGQIDS